MCEVLCHWLPLCQIPDWIWEFRKLVISKWQNWWWYLCIIGFHRNEQAMPFGWLMLYILRGYKNSISKVGTRCEEAEVQRNESLAPDRNTCECGAQQIYGKLVTFRFFIEYVSAALLYTEDAGTCVSHAVPECTQDLQIHGGSVWSINKYLSKYLSVKKTTKQSKPQKLLENVCERACIDDLRQGSMATDWNTWSFSWVKRDFHLSNLGIQIKVFHSFVDGLKAVFTSLFYIQFPAERRCSRTKLFRKTQNEPKTMLHARRGSEFQARF